MTKALVGWKQVNERIITARLCTKHAKVTVVWGVYAPAESASDRENDAFMINYRMCLTIFPATT